LGQRVIRFYDPDGHIIDAGENIDVIARHFRERGMTASKIAVRMDMGEKYVQEWQK